MSPSSSWKTRTGERGTLLGPLTTAWSPPADCGVHLVTCPTCLDGYQAQHCVGDAPQDFTGCWPPAASNIASPKYPYLGWGYYSPGLACPTGYTAACSATYGANPDWQIQFDLFPGETAIGCCPPGYQCANNDGNTCYTVVSATPTAIQTGMCSRGTIVGISLATLPAPMTITATTTVDGGATTAVRTETPEFTIWAPMFQLNHRVTDLPSSSTLSSGSQGTSTTAGPPNSKADGAGSTAGLASSSSSATAAAQSSGLSTAAVAGIGVGAGLAALLLVAIVGCLWWRRVKKRRVAGAAAAAEVAGDEKWNPSSQPSTEAWVPADGAHYYAGRSEMPTKEALAYMRPELGNLPSAVELPPGAEPLWRETRV